MKLSIWWPTYGNFIRMGGATCRMGGATSFPYPALPSSFKTLLYAPGLGARHLLPLPGVECLVSVRGTCCHCQVLSARSRARHPTCCNYYMLRDRSQRATSLTVTSHYRQPKAVTTIFCILTKNLFQLIVSTEGNVTLWVVMRDTCAESRPRPVCFSVVCSIRDSQ